MELFINIAKNLFIVFLIFEIYLFLEAYFEKRNDKRSMEKLKGDQQVEEERLPNVAVPSVRYYMLNTHSVKYYQYDCFEWWSTRNIYQNVILERLWLKEPFHTAFATLLLLLDRNELWIKLPNSKELILTNRDQNEKLCHGVSLKVVYLTSLLADILERVSEMFRYQKASVQQFVILGVTVKLIWISKKIETVEIDKELDGRDLILWLFETMSKDEQQSLEKYFDYVSENKIVENILENQLRYRSGFKRLVELKNDKDETLKEPLILPNLPKKRLLPLETTEKLFD